MSVAMMLGVLRNVSLQRRVCIVASVHLVALVYGLYATIDEIIMAEEPFDEREAVMVGCNFLFQLVLITCLYVGALKLKPLCMLPWLTLGFAAFSIATYLVCKYSELRFFTEFLFNWICIGVFWYSWITVYKFYKEGYVPLDNRKYVRLKSRERDQC